MKTVKFPDVEQSHRFEDTHLEIKQLKHNKDLIIINVKIDGKDNFHILNKESSLDLAAYILRCFDLEVNF